MADPRCLPMLSTGGATSSTTAQRYRMIRPQETAMKRFVLCFVLFAFSGTAVADTPFQFAVPNHQFPKDPVVSGVRLSIFHGVNEAVRGVDFGILSLSETSNLSGLGLVAGMGKVTGEMTGAAIGLINVHTSIDTGLNAAFINRLNTTKGGANVGFVNMADGFTMVDIGGLNVSDQSTVQLGFVNVTKKIKGVQIGFLNVAENGFLPVFPIFNFPKKGTAGSD
jgi:hypothetical protein